jgi:hypothetical protein
MFVRQEKAAYEKTGGAGSLAQTRLWLHFPVNREIYREFGGFLAPLMGPFVSSLRAISTVS